MFKKIVSRFILVVSFNILAFNASGESMNRDVYKILTYEQMTTLNSSGEFYGSAHDIRDGFIHLTGTDELEGVIDRYFSSLERIFILKFSEGDLGDNLKWEEGSDGKLYPHLYVLPLLRSQVLEVVEREL